MFLHVFLSFFFFLSLFFPCLKQHPTFCPIAGSPLQGAKSCFRQAECHSEGFGVHFCFWSLASRLSSPSTSQLFYLPSPLLATSYVVSSRHKWGVPFSSISLFRTGKHLLDTHFPTMRHIPYLLSTVVPATTRSPPFIEQRTERTRKRNNEEIESKTYPLM
ncbi:hypothetical protein B0T13DRAFT_464304 [Neurospora crassa]|nr:hypothetical protein B0T13DRAFT_464304 [Neurospora crassa]